jgi:NADPH-dependent 2,4-dienoyl-CoA reductase/sulfur reductase-like enzyme
LIFSHSEGRKHVRVKGEILYVSCFILDRRILFGGYRWVTYVSRCRVAFISIHHFIALRRSRTLSSNMEKTSKKKAIVIGAGVGGTATAARLACAGFEVDVYEKVCPMLRSFMTRKG